LPRCETFFATRAWSSEYSWHWRARAWRGRWPQPKRTSNIERPTSNIEWGNRIASLYSVGQRLVICRQPGPLGENKKLTGTSTEKIMRGPACDTHLTSDVEFASRHERSRSEQRASPRLAHGRRSPRSVRAPLHRFSAGRRSAETQSCCCRSGTTLRPTLGRLEGRRAPPRDAWAWRQPSARRSPIAAQESMFGGKSV